MQYGLTSEEAKPISDANIGPDFIYELVYMLATTPKAKVLEYVYNKDTKHANIVFEGPMMAQTVSSARREEELLREGEKPEPEGIYECPYCGSSKDTVSSTNFVRRGDEPPIITGYCVSCKKSFKISG
jgi:DNA-directed RNA polymerase subunit M/transcription elongation factor TFIIS